MARSQAALAFKTDHEWYGAPGFLRSANVVAVEQHRRLELPIKWCGNGGQQLAVHWRAAVFGVLEAPDTTVAE